MSEANEQARPEGPAYSFDPSNLSSRGVELVIQRNQANYNQGNDSRKKKDIHLRPPNSKESDGSNGVPSKTRNSAFQSRITSRNRRRSCDESLPQLPQVQSPSKSASKARE